MKKLISVSVALCIVITSLFTGIYAFAQDTTVTSADVKTKIDNTVNYLVTDTSTFTEANVGDLVTYINSGKDMSAYKDGFVESIKANLEKNEGKIIVASTTWYQDENGDWQSYSSTYENAATYAGTILALKAFGEDPTSFDGYNLVDTFKSFELKKDNENQYYFRLIFAAAEQSGFSKSEIKTLTDFFVNNYYELGVGSTYYTSCDSTSQFVVSLAAYADSYSSYITDALTQIETYKFDGGYKYDLGEYSTEANSDSTALALAAYSAAGDVEKATEIYNELAAYESTTSAGAYTYGGYESAYSTKDALLGLEYYYDALYAYEQLPEVRAERAASKAEAAAKQASEDAKAASEAKADAEKALSEAKSIYEQISAANKTTATTTTAVSTTAAAETTSSTETTSTTAAAKTVKKPKKTSIKKTKAAKSAFTVQWKKVSGVKGYQVQYSTSKKFTKKTSKKVTVSGQKKTSKKIKKLKSNKKYYVRVRTYKVVNGKKVYSNWSKAKTVKTK